MLLPLNSRLLSAIDGLCPLVLGLFALFLLFGLLRADLTFLQLFHWPLPLQIGKGL